MPTALALAWVGRLADEGELEIDPDCVPVALSSARQYLSAANFPGSALDLIKLTANGFISIIWHLKIRVRATTPVYLIRRTSSGRRCRKRLRFLQSMLT